MSKGQRGNKEAKKPKKLPSPDKSLVPVGTTPAVLAALPDRPRRK